MSLIYDLFKDLSEWTEKRIRISWWTLTNGILYATAFNLFGLGQTVNKNLPVKEIPFLPLLSQLTTIIIVHMPSILFWLVIGIFISSICMEVAIHLPIKSSLYADKEHQPSRDWSAAFGVSSILSIVRILIYNFWTIYFLISTLYGNTFSSERQFIVTDKVTLCENMLFWVNLFLTIFLLLQSIYSRNSKYPGLASIFYGTDLRYYYSICSFVYTPHQGEKRKIGILKYIVPVLGIDTYIIYEATIEQRRLNQDKFVDGKIPANKIVYRRMCSYNSLSEAKIHYDYLVQKYSKP